MRKITLPADVYDTLEFSSLVYGGLGSRKWYSHEYDDQSPPWCPLGHLMAAGVDVWQNGDTRPVNLFGLDFKTNDLTFIRCGWTGRVPFADWAKELHVKRGLPDEV